MTSCILAGDIGGTRARFALLEPTGRKVLYQEVLESRSFGSFEAVLTRFLANAGAPSNGRSRSKSSSQSSSKSSKSSKSSSKRPGEVPGTIAAASFGIAGPVVDQRVKTTNLPWVIEAAGIAADFHIPRVTLLNDLVAVGLGALAAPASKLRSIHLGNPRRTGGNVAVIAAGTGLGEASFVWDGRTHVPCSTEGAHVDYAPRTPVEVELLQLLAREYGHVSYERVASASTIGMLYTFFVREQRVPESKAAASMVARAEDQNVAVVELALAGKSEAAMRAIELWSSVYGAEAGNLALKSLATAGIFICGGASARLADVLENGLPARRKALRGRTQASPFIESFLDKGRMRPLLEKIPIAVCTESLAGLMGAAAHAAEQAAAAPEGRSSRVTRPTAAKPAATRTVRAGTAAKRRARGA